jgi:glycosyltransferase involved in cell wall biosynthesis
MKFSLIVSTRGRVDELKTLFRSLADQTSQDFEVIVSDQNDDDRLEALLQSPHGFPVTHIRSSGGVSRGRNMGLAEATGEICCFPDDDCAYVPRLLEEVAVFFEQNPGFGYLCGRSFADDGEDSVSRHSKTAAEIDRRNILSQCIEFAIFIRRSALGDDRFDEAMGPGAPTPWQCDEGPDLLLRLMAKGVRGYYDPAVMAWHRRPVTNFGPKDIDRTYRYGCGNGYFYRRHGYSVWTFGHQIVKTVAAIIIYSVCGQWGRARLYVARLKGRWRGWKAGRETLARPVLEVPASR